MLTLYTYFRSSASFRVRIALNLKGLAYEAIPVHLLAGGGEQLRPQFRAINPMRLVPVLQHGAETLTQSLAIIEYLDELHPEPPLLGRSALERARIRAVALDIACEIHPLDNLHVLNYLVGEFVEETNLDTGAQPAFPLSAAPTVSHLPAPKAKQL